MSCKEPAPSKQRQAQKSKYLPKQLAQQELGNPSWDSRWWGACYLLCQSATQKSRQVLGGSHTGHHSTHSSLLGDWKAILAVVLKRVALTNNSEFGYPTFFLLPLRSPLSLTKEAVQLSISKYFPLCSQVSCYDLCGHVHHQFWSTFTPRKETLHPFRCPSLPQNYFSGAAVTNDHTLSGLRQ